jgi:uncharacterized membrane protein
MNPERSEERETDRMEAFSDGVFAFAITFSCSTFEIPPRRAARCS